MHIPFIGSKIKVLILHQSCIINTNKYMKQEANEGTTATTTDSQDNYTVHII